MKQKLVTEKHSDEYMHYRAEHSYQEIRNLAAVLLPPGGISPVLLWDNTDTTAGLPRGELRRTGPLGSRATVLFR